MLPALNIPAQVSSQCPSLPHTVPSATAKQRLVRYHLLLGLVQHFLSLYRFPSPSIPTLPSPTLSPVHPLYRSLSRLLLISNTPNFYLKLPGVPDGSDSSDRASYHLMENYTFPGAQAMGRVVYLHPLLCAWYTYHQNDMCNTLFAGATGML